MNYDFTKSGFLENYNFRNILDFEEVKNYLL